MLLLLLSALIVAVAFSLFPYSPTGGVLLFLLAMIPASLADRDSSERAIALLLSLACIGFFIDWYLYAVQAA